MRIIIDSDAYINIVMLSICPNEKADAKPLLLWK